MNRSSKVVAVGIIGLIFIAASIGLIISILASYGTTEPSSEEQNNVTPNIEAAVEAKVQATISAMSLNNPTSEPKVIKESKSTPTPSPTTTPTSVPTPTPRPIPMPTPISYFCEGKTIRFKIGSIWANETGVYEGGGATIVNLTASTAKLPLNGVISWPISYLTPPNQPKFFTQEVPPVIFVGTVYAADHTVISAWIDGFQVADTTVVDGNWSLLITNYDCFAMHGIPTPTPIPVATRRPPATPQPPTPTPRPTATPKPSRAITFGEGTRIVGSDILHGTYRSSKANSGCYWERLSGFSGDFGDMIANEFTDELTVVEIAPTDAGFSSENCGVWTQATSPITPSLISPFNNGVFVIGLDVSSGTWSSPGGDSCYWERLSGFSGEFKHLEANDFGGSYNVVTIKPTDEGFATTDCGTWTKN